MAHITAGDISPITYRTESTYGTPDTSVRKYYGDVAEGGKFTVQNSNNPYLSWRYGSRSYDPGNYVTQQQDAAYSDVLEVRDLNGWTAILKYALGTDTGTEDYGELPSRTSDIFVRTGAGTYQGIIYRGCKTDSLTIKADAPGGIVKFEESVLASENLTSDISTPLSQWSVAGPAIQWRAAVTIGANTIYPQSFSITINNNLSRSYAPRQTSGPEATTGALLEGRREITAEFDIWMEDLSNIRASLMNNQPGNIVMVLGTQYRVQLTLSGVRWVADGSSYPDFIQDKQREVLKFRASAIGVQAV